jgi:HSP20 family molecular chaperone IbpA
MNNKSNVYVVSNGLGSTTGTYYASTTAAFPATATTTVSSYATGIVLNANSSAINTLPQQYKQTLSKGLSYDDYWHFNEEFDLLWKSFFDSNSVFKPVKEKVVNHPCDIRETDDGLRIELTAVGIEEQELDIIVDSETLRVAYRKTEDEKKEEKNQYRYLHRSIKKASFDIAWKISSKYDLHKLVATLEKGLLVLDIPYAKENKPKKITIGKSK